jgi:hypothetical protein
MKQKKLYVYPTTVETMASILKQLCFLYLSEQLTLIQFESEILDLKNKFNSLFISALSVRWIGKKRVRLISTFAGNLQYSLF